MMCNRCKKDFIQIESHHVWCKVMDNPSGLTWKEYPNRFNLCLACHRALHREIIIQILNECARTLKFNGSEHWTWIQVAHSDKEETIEKVCSATLKFVMEYEDGNTRTT